MQSSFTLGNKKLIELCKTPAKDQKTTQRLDAKTKEPYEIYQHQYKHQAGMCFFYENKTADRTLQETITFQISGLEIVGNGGKNDVKFTLGPGQTKLIELKAISFPWKSGMGIQYGIGRA